MNYLIKFSKGLLWLIGSMLILTLLITLLNYFNILNGKALSIFKITTIVISFFISGIIIGKNSTKKGWLEGIKFFIICLLSIVLLKKLTTDKLFVAKDLLYYSIVLFSTIFGSVIGINKSVNN